jgi:xanthine dehydrogenase small subunit
VKISFTVNGVPREVDAAPLRRLLDILREDLGLTGTKEGCGEGECGACAVLLDGALANSCLVPAAQLPGRSVVTIEALGSAAAPDPVQQAFLDEGAVQCGFCIPGMVLATHALLERDPAPDEATIRAGLSGNICRCTGYERIVRAVQRAAGAAVADGREAGMKAAARSPGPGPAAAPRPPSAPPPGPRFRAPATLAEALTALQAGASDSIFLAGGTDLMLPGAQASTASRFVLDLSRVEGLAGVHLHASAPGRDAVEDAVGDAVEIGAATTVTTLTDDPLVNRRLPALATAARLFGAPAIRNRATLGGNIAGASPAADLPPALLALGATVILASASGRRELPLEDFYTGYRQTVRRLDELIVAVRVPLPAPDTRQTFLKAGTRRAQSIARVSVAGAARVDAAGRLRSVRLAAGSVAPVPVLLVETMRFLEGRRLDARLMAEADRRAAAEVSPISDVRSNDAYRRFVTGRFVAQFLRGCVPK